MTKHTDSLTSATTKFAEDQQATFCSAKGGCIDIVGITPSKNLSGSQIDQIKDYASELLASFGTVPSVAREVGKKATFGLFAGATAHTLGADGVTAIMALGAAGLSGVFSSATNGSIPHNKGKGGKTL